MWHQGQTTSDQISTFMPGPTPGIRSALPGPLGAVPVTAPDGSSTATALTAAGVRDGAIHREYFATAGPAPGADVVTVRAVLGGEDATVRTDRRTTITDALEAAGYAPPATCRSGSCSTCVARVLDGTTSMSGNYALGTGEVSEDWSARARRPRPVRRSPSTSTTPLAHRDGGTCTVEAGVDSRRRGRQHPAA